MAIISKISCPRCNSSNLYKFGKDKHGHQKYQCKLCKRQFTLNQLSKPKPYPKCTKCGRGTYIHHDHKHHTRFKCNDRKCNHTFSVIKPTSIDSASCNILFGKNIFKRMRYPLYVVITSLNMFYLCNASSRKISQFLYLNQNIKVSHVTIASWAKKFAPLFNSITSNFSSSINLNSDEWHADETIVKINGRKYFLWFVIDSETRFVISFHLSPYRNSPQAFSVLQDSSSYGTPNSIVTDRLGSYDAAVNAVFKNANHIKVQSFKDVISNNIIESFNDTFKSWYKPKRGFCSFESANNLISTFVFFYNFIRPHSSLSNLSPAQVAGATYCNAAKQTWLLVA